MMPTRDDAWALLYEYTASENLRKHSLAVEACVRAYAAKTPAAQTGATASSAEEEVWGLAALLHDFDYERWPNHEHHPTEGHPSSGARILREHGYPEEVIHAILAHAAYTGVPRQSPLDHALFACDEMAGFLTACSLVKPGKTIFEVEPASVKRKMKDKAFARGVSREDLALGAQELGLPIEEHIAFCIAAMCGVATQLGLERKAGA
jgi:putative nucleotidyltransferase with HDIG domain